MGLSQTVLARHALIIGLVGSLVFTNIAFAQTSASKTLHVSVNSPGSYPYLFLDPNSKHYAGLVVDFFEYLQQKGIFNTQFSDSNQLRSEQFLNDGKADIYLANPDWLTQPSKFITSIPLIEHATYLYSLQPFEQGFSLENLSNNRICAHQNFKYTGLQPYFDAHKVQRIDASSQSAMATMLKSERCDYVIMNDYNAMTIFSGPEYCNLHVYQSPQPTSVVNLYLIMRPELSEIKLIIDQQLTTFISSGKAKASLAAHSSIPHFPLHTICSVQ
jgi:polar amino acid transport system substrate-binding protein